MSQLIANNNSTIPSDCSRLQSIVPGQVLLLWTKIMGRTTWTAVLHSPSKKWTGWTDYGLHTIRAAKRGLIVVLIIIVGNG